MLSPVSIASSTDDEPETTTPSTGSLSPGLTTIISSTLTSSIGITFSFPSIITVAVFGANPINLFIASDVLPFVRASKNLPRLINATIIPADSKYKWCAK